MSLNFFKKKDYKEGFEPIEVSGVHVQDGRELLKNYVTYTLKPQLLKAVEEKIGGVESLKEASTQEKGIVRIATQEEVDRLNGEVYAVLTPQKARSVFMEKTTFDVFENEIKNLLSDKADASALDSLSNQLNEMTEKINALSQALDSINGAVI